VRGRYIDEDDLNETLANQIVSDETISESGSINNELEDGEIIDYDSTDPDIPDLVDDDEEDEEIFAIDYDTTENTRNTSNWVTRSPYNDIENSFIVSASDTSDVNEDNNVTFTFNIRVPEIIGSVGIPPIYEEEDDEDTEEDEGYDSF